MVELTFLKFLMIVISCVSVLFLTYSVRFGKIAKQRHLQMLNTYIIANHDPSSKAMCLGCAETGIRKEMEAVERHIHCNGCGRR